MNTILKAIFAVSLSAPLMGAGGIQVDWTRDLSNDGSTNHIPIALSPADEALTLTLTDGVCLGGSWAPCTALEPTTGFVSLKRHESDGDLASARVYFPLGSPNIKSRRDIVREPQSGLYWISMVVESYPDRHSRFLVADAAGNTVADWSDATADKWSADLTAGEGGTVFAASMQGGELVVDKYSAPGTLAWSYFHNTPLSGGDRVNGVAALEGGGAVAATFDGSQNQTELIRLDSAGSLLWTVTAPGSSIHGSLQTLTRGAENSIYVASGVTGSGKIDCQVLKVLADGSVQTLAQWSADPSGSTLGSIQWLANGNLLVGGQAGSKPYLAVLSPAGALLADWYGPSSTWTMVKATAQRSDGNIYFSVYAIDWVNYRAVSQLFSAQIGPITAPTPVPTVVPTTVPTAEATAVPTAVPTPLLTEIPTAVPTLAPTATATPLPTNCQVTVERLQTVPCPLRGDRGGKLKIRLAGCQPAYVRITIFSQGMTVVAEWTLDGGSFAPGWNTVDIPAGLLGPGTHYFRATAMGAGVETSATGACTVLR